MKNKLVFAAVLFSLAIIIISGCFYFSLKGIDAEDEKSEYIVSLNEIQKLNESGDHNAANEKIALLQEDIRKEKNKSREIRSIAILCGISVLFIAFTYGYIYFAVLRPFDKMKNFASEISAGNFDLPLKYERSNYFGEFTWAFDSMRTEITKARNGETLAIENNKTVIASLSHDIKTPIASIRAYAEGLSANMDTSFEKREKYLSVIIKKCDEVSRLTDDLFLHSLSDLDKLRISPEKTELSEFLERTLS
ncbi:MAG: sensor histidine kinase, partial [Ruminiclostridium sp.]|nr:sensor histidine kinase [Ruminiclostridium sp.]